MAQARVFDQLLREGIDDLTQLAESVEAEWISRREHGTGNDKRSQELSWLEGRLNEAHRLLDALRNRFSQDLRVQGRWALAQQDSNYRSPPHLGRESAIRWLPAAA
jgi:hypothetical protein